MKKRSITITIPRNNDSYDVLIGAGLIARVGELIDLERYSKIGVITDTTIAAHWLQTVKKAIKKEIVEIVISAREQDKNIATVGQIWEQLLDRRFDRKSLVINLGGGVISDMGGFVASTYKRGVDFVHIPTTLLAAVDASVGGKVGVNHAGIKNVIGSFNQPRAVIVDVDTLASLPDRAFISGFAEVIKHGLIADVDYFKTVTSKKPRAFSKDELIDIITKSCEIKAGIVEADEQESDERKKLNFGHTLGHALEALELPGKHPLTHGEAISIGMVGEAKLSSLLQMIAQSDITTIELAFKKAGLPVRSSELPVLKILEKIRNDKKNEDGRTQWTLLNGIGQAVVNVEADRAKVQTAIEYVMEKKSELS